MKDPVEAFLDGEEDTSVVMPDWRAQRGRTDPHRPGAITPTDYDIVLWYALACTVDGWPQPSVNVDRVVELRRDPNVKWAPTGSLGKCSVCGANYNYGEVWRHRPTGEHIHVGHDCADKYSMLADRTEWEDWHRQQHDLRAVAVQKRVRAEARDAFYASHPGLQEALGLDHDVLRDMAGKLYRYGSLSVKQVAYAMKLADEVLHPKPEEAHVPAPEGRVDVQGRVVSMKEQDSDWGTVVKMLVKTETQEGSWLCWVTCPDALAAYDLRGQEVEFTATLTRSDRDDYFAFGKRPTRARVVGGREDAGGTAVKDTVVGTIGRCRNCGHSAMCHVASCFVRGCRCPGWDPDYKEEER